MRKIVVGSRRSKLALTQTKWVIDQLKQLGVPFEFEIKEIVTKGDRILDITLSKVGGKGLFVKEIEQAMLNKEIDMAVHSMKDMPAVLPDGLMIGCVPKREDPRDVLISKRNVPLRDLSKGAVIGTSSLRRSAQLLSFRPDLNIKWIRGNIDTRLAKLETEEYDGIILAAAGLSRMGWSDEVITEYLHEDICLPAVGQGALAIECREDDEELLRELQRLNCRYTASTVMAERTFLHRLEGGCQVPIAGYATMNKGNDIILTGMVGTPDGRTILKDQAIGKDPVAVGEALAKKLMDLGAKKMIDAVKEDLERS
ncbi:hydroxymethylbilane synthase [Aeribacillus pallidus]|jgi:hydroxymethylbilane synthase|uniref:hydroxymethylbilane synthase n=1 Tax=Aeribacillus pallidus TaxID=33936 RepID=UPI001D2020E4|nr:hydroxymethylbilane synthase [Bacillus sp. (in: firmicutes)]